MKTIKIFLASSIKEFADERISLKNFIRQLENTLIDYGVFIKMFICEYADNAVADGRKQDEFSKKIDDSDIFMILAGEHLGEFTLEEYEYALNVRQKRGNMKILACFKACGEVRQSVRDFSENLCADAIKVDFNDIADLKSELKTVIYDMPDEPPPVEIKIRKINLFLTSSLRELDRDIEELGAFVCDLNDRYTPQNLYFQLNISGEDDLTDNIDDIEIKAVQDSELFYIIFHDEPQNRAKAEFEAAYAAFREKKTPKIITYYKKLESDSPGQSAMAFMDKLRNELGHFNSKYTHMDTVKLNIMLQLKSLGLDHITVDVKDSSLVVDGQKMFTLDNIPLIFNNKNIAALKEEYNCIEEEYFALRERVRKDPDDEDALAAYLSVSGKKNKINEAIHSLQKDILVMETSFLEKAGSGYISPRQRQARLCLEDGDIEGAKQLLDFDSMMLEDERDDEIFTEIQKKKSAKVNEYLYLAGILITEVSNPDRFDKIERAYEQAIKEVEEKYNLEERSATNEYAWYLLGQRDYEKALKYSLRYLRWLESKEEREDFEIPAACIMVGECYLNLNRMNESEELLNKAAAVYETRLHLKSYFAYCLNRLAMVYEKTQRYTEAEEAYKKALFIYKALAAENPAVYEYSVAHNYESLANLYSYNSRYTEAEELFAKAVNIEERLLESDPNVLPALARIYASAACMCAAYDYQLYERAEELYESALYIYKNLSIENPAVYEPDLAINLHNTASLYKTLQRYDEAEDFYKKAMVIQERLAAEIPAAHEPLLAEIYMQSAILCGDTGRYAAAEELYKKSAAIRERLAAENPAEEEPNLAYLYKTMAVFYKELERFAEAEELYKKAVVVYEHMVSNATQDMYEKYEDLRDLSLDDLGTMYIETERFAEAEELFKKTVAIYEHLASDVMKGTYKRYEVFYINALANLSSIYINEERYADAEEIVKKALIICERQVSDATPQTYEEYEISYAKSLNTLGILYIVMERYDEAQPLYQRAYEIWLKLAEEYIEDDYYYNEVSAQAYRIGLLYECMGYIESAKEWWRWAADSWKAMDEEKIGEYIEDFEEAKNRLEEYK